MTAPLHPGLQLVSRLFSYLEGPIEMATLPAGLEAEARAAIAELNDTPLVRLQNEYVRLFINSLPEVACAPYGSVYLEGTVMGETTVAVRNLYRWYGVAPSEMADHIAVEAEFLAWLHQAAAGDEQARQDYDFLLTHLRSWAPAFFDRVELHDQLGCYQQGARLARAILDRLALPTEPALP